jgi:predicted small integral membrane protein
MITRTSKALAVGMVGVLLLLVGIDNILDYGSNFAFVGHVLSMDTLFPDTTLKWRAITSPLLHHAAFALIIAFEITSGLLCLLGAKRLWQLRAGPAASFNSAKGAAVAGLMCGITLYLFGFLVIAGEWFQMWQSQQWNAQSSAFRFMVVIALVLIFLNQRDEDR